MMHATPYDGSSRLFQIGTRPLPLEDWLEPDACLAEQLREKARLQALGTPDIFAELPESRAAQAELLALLVDYLPARFPHLWQATGTGLRILPLDQVVATEAEDAPLAVATKLVQDDLLLLQRGDEGWRLTAGSLAFPSSWVLGEKIGKRLDAIHDPVPGFGPGTRSAQIMARMFDATRPDMPMIRWNFSLYGDDRLHHPDSLGPGVRRFGTGQRADPVVLRVERQTLRKLPETGAMAFAIRISTESLDQLASRPNAPAIAAALIDQVRALTPEQLDYKGLTLEKDRLLARLAELVAS